MKKFFYLLIFLGISYQIFLKKDTVNSNKTGNGDSSFKPYKEISPTPSQPAIPPERAREYMFDILRRFIPDLSINLDFRDLSKSFSVENINVYMERGVYPEEIDAFKKALSELERKLNKFVNQEIYSIVGRCLEIATKNGLSLSNDVEMLDFLEKCGAQILEDKTKYEIFKEKIYKDKIYQNLKHRREV